jgi:hypothetical protein
MPAILLGQHCRLCRSLVPASIAGQPINVVAAKMGGTAMPRNPGLATYGSEENGFMCEKCVTLEPEHMRKLANQVSEFWDKEVYIDMGAAIAPPCAICDTTDGDTRVLEDYEGTKALLCKPCADRYLRANRDKIRGTKLEYELKLR